MWTIWSAPSDRDYYDQFNRLEPEAEEPDESEGPKCAHCGRTALPDIELCGACALELARRLVNDNEVEE